MFNKAQRKLAKLRLGICGPSGSGKTWSALEIASGISNKIALIDTERSGHTYAEDFNFDIAELDSPYSPQRYIEKIKEAERLGYEMLIIDSLSHAWVGEGGVLSIADRSGGTFQQGWRTATPQQNALIDAIITSKLHIIVTMRSKTEYVVEPNEKGKMAPRKVGLAPVQRDGLEYEFTMFMDMNQEHFAHITKDRTKLYDQQFIKPNKEMGSTIMSWLQNGKSSEEIMLETLSNVSEILEKSKTSDELKESFNTCLRKYPALKEQIIPLAQKVRSNLHGEIH